MQLSSIYPWVKTKFPISIGSLKTEFLMNNGVLFAINIDGTENQQLMSIFKNEKRGYYNSYYGYLSNLQSIRMVNVLNDDFEHILVETRGMDGYPIIYKLNIFTGEKEEIENAKKYRINYWLVDRNGLVRFGIQNEDGKTKFFTKNDQGKWESKNELNLDMTAVRLSIKNSIF